MRGFGPKGLLATRLRELSEMEVLGRVVGVTGPVVRARGVNAVVGQQVELWRPGSDIPIPAEAIGLDNDDILLMALGELEGVGPGCHVSAGQGDPQISVGDQMLGRIIDGLGRPLDGMALEGLTHKRSLRGRPPNPMSRTRITDICTSGVRAIDAMATLGYGQRMGIFAGAGVGKSTLLSMITRYSDADACVVALIGERGREVREFVEDAITSQNRKRTVVVAVTGDAAPLVRIRGALLAATIAEHLRAEGRKILFLFDSLTRYAMALREVGLAGGELPASKGYPPSVFVELSRLLERAGNDDIGGITGMYTVLVEGDDLADPVADSAMSLLDGHIILSRDLANRGIYPPVDVLSSTSRLMPQVAPREHILTATQATSILATYQQAEDLIRIGAYRPGSDPQVDLARKFMPNFEQFISQDLNDGSSFALTQQLLAKLVAQHGQAGGVNNGR